MDNERSKILWSSSSLISLNSDRLNDLISNIEESKENGEESIKEEITLEELLVKIAEASLPYALSTSDAQQPLLIDNITRSSAVPTQFSNSVKVAKYQTQIPISTGNHNKFIMKCFCLLIICLCRCKGRN